MIVLKCFRRCLGRFRPLGVMPKAEDQASERVRLDHANGPRPASSPLQGDLQGQTSNLTLRDGIAVSYANFSPIEDGIKHVYKECRHLPGDGLCGEQPRLRYSGPLPACGL